MFRALTSWWRGPPPGRPGPSSPRARACERRDGPELEPPQPSRLAAPTADATAVHSVRPASPQADAVRAAVHAWLLDAGARQPEALPQQDEAMVARRGSLGASDARAPSDTSRSSSPSTLPTSGLSSAASDLGLSDAEATWTPSAPPVVAPGSLAQSPASASGAHGPGREPRSLQASTASGGTLRPPAPSRRALAPAPQAAQPAYSPTVSSPSASTVRPGAPLAAALFVPGPESAYVLLEAGSGSEADGEAWLSDMEGG